VNIGELLGSITRRPCKSHCTHSNKWWLLNSKRETKAEESCMRVGILGSGLMGGKLGTIFSRAGHEVVFSYARSARKLQRLAREARGRARAGTPEEAALQA